jgi:NTE family protein
VAQTVRRPWAFRPDVAALTLLPPGLVDASARAAPLHALVGDRWPDGLWVCASRCRDGGRVVFGRPGSPHVALARAVLASCAIPGYFRPVEIGGVSYFDGGVHSPTNADVLRNEHLDVVVVVSPMSAAGHYATADGAVRLTAHARLAGEARRLEAGGTTVIGFEPGRAARSAMGFHPLAEDRGERIVRAAFAETEAALARTPAIRRSLGAVGATGPSAGE